MKNSNTKAETSWCVITAGPRAGKSTVLEALKQRGYKVVREVARDFIDEQLLLGRKIEEILANQLLFQRAVLQRMVRIENELNKEDKVFFDRAVPDGIGYYRKAGLDPSEVFALCRPNRYSRVFFLDQIPTKFAEEDEIRRETDEEIDTLGEEIKRGYLELGYELIPVPLMPVAERVRFILNFLDNHPEISE